jgi:hypothetical protein
MLMQKKMTLLRTSFALASALFASTAAFAQAIQVSNEAELKTALSDTSADIVLTQDITLSGEWIPIGTEDTLVFSVGIVYAGVAHHVSVTVECS